mgnify:CR=1 FL=1
MRKYIKHSSRTMTDELRFIPVEGQKKEVRRIGNETFEREKDVREYLEKAVTPGWIPGYVRISAVETVFIEKR